MGRGVVRFERRPELSGVEVRTFEAISKDFRCYSPDYEFLTTRSWRGEVWHRRRRVQMEPGLLLCAHPGEVFSGRATVGGELTSLTIAPEVLASVSSEQSPSLAPLRFPGLVHMSDELQHRLSEVRSLLRPGPPLSELHTSLVRLVRAFTEELTEPAEG
ncbi:MAG TPA: AraC family ligand binding domain-containing protein, partial [Polyangiaceae bacterium]